VSLSRDDGRAAARGRADRAVGAGSPSQQPDHRGPANIRRALPVAALVVAAWAVLPPYVGPGIHTPASREVADHVVPAVVLLAVSAAALFLVPQMPRPGPFLFLAGLVTTLAGIWMVSTHVPLVTQARRHEVSWLAAAHHSLPGLAVLVLGLVWSATWWSDAA
jgi:hypothetical protein